MAKKDSKSGSPRRQNNNDVAGQKKLPLNSDGADTNAYPKSKLIFQLKAELHRYQQRDQEWKMMFNMLAHDLKEPLLTLEGFTKLIAEPNLDPRDRKKYIKVIREAVNSLHDLVGSLQSVSKLYTEAQEFTDISLKDLLNSVITSLSTLIEKNNGTIILPKQDVVFKGDPVRLYQVFLNLISNSLKYHRKKIDPVISIRYRKESEVLRISIKDNGVGIEKEDLEKIFEPFSRIEGTRSEGLGIGLSIVKRIAESFGGQVSVKSRQDHGTTFTLLLPRTNAQRSLDL